MKTKIQILKVAIILFIVTFAVVCSAFAGDADTLINGKTYKVGARGGVYELKNGSKHYLCKTRAIVTDTQVTIDGVSYPIETGKRGGRYYIINGTKKYLSSK